MKLFFLIFIGALILMSSCSSSSRGDKIDVISDHILATLAKNMKKKGLRAIGTGGGQKDGKINLIEITFTTNRLLTVEEGRKLIIESTDPLWDLINDTPSHKEYFIRFPVSEKIIALGIIGITPEKKDFLNYIKTVSIARGIISYDTYDPEGISKPYLEVHQETYQEAKEILAKQTSDLFQ